MQAIAKSSISNSRVAHVNTLSPFSRKLSLIVIVQQLVMQKTHVIDMKGLHTSTAVRMHKSWTC